MHPNPIYRSDDRARALEMVRARRFGVLTVAGPGGVLASHVPFVAGEDRIAAHLVRSNPIARLLRDGPAAALMIVSGPDGYISPDWYGLEDQVPTWNYVAVHLRGTLTLLEQDRLLAHLERLSEINETALLPKKPWTHDKMTPGVMDKMMRQIVPVEMEIAEIDSTWKLNQNKTAEARQEAAAAVEHAPAGHEQPALAALMRAVPPG